MQTSPKHNADCREETHLLTSKHGHKGFKEVSEKE